MTDKNNASNEELRVEQTFDFAEPPAPIEMHAYSKRAGEIIARGAANSQEALGAAASGGVPDRASIARCWRRIGLRSPCFSPRRTVNFFVLT